MIFIKLLFVKVQSVDDESGNEKINRLCAIICQPRAIVTISLEKYGRMDLGG